MMRLGNVNVFPLAMGIIVVSLNVNCTMLTCLKVYLKKKQKSMYDQSVVQNWFFILDFRAQPYWQCG